MPTLKRIGILTGGGDAPGLNAVIRTVAKKSILEHGAKVIGIEDGFEGLIRHRTRALDLDAVSGILDRGGTILGTTNRGNPLDHHGKDVSASVVRYVKKLRLDALVCVGGDGTMTISHRLRELGAPVVGVPKTIDNDVVGTDVTFGFDTAVSVAAGAIDALHSTADSHGRVLVVEMMGRHAGWIALTAGLAGGADVILIPEVPFDFGSIASFIRERHKRRRFTIIAVAEGAHLKRGGGDGGIGAKVAAAVERRTRFESRTVVLGHLQRSGPPTAADRVLASRYASAAVDLAAEGAFGNMVALQGGAIVAVPMDLVAGRTKYVPPDHDVMRVARSVGTSFGEPTGG